MYSHVRCDPQHVDVPVIGGHAGITILPLFSQATGIDSANLSEDDIKALNVCTQDGGTKVVQAKAGKGSATLSMAYAAAIFGDACMRGMSGEAPVECTYIETDIVPGLSFFATPCQLGKHGVESVLGNGTLNKFEQEGLEMLKAELKSSIDKGIEYVKQNPV
jgi:malate dehydrogenase